MCSCFCGNDAKNYIYKNLWWNIIDDFRATSVNMCKHISEIHVLINVFLFNVGKEEKSMELKESNVYWGKINFNVSSRFHYTCCVWCMNNSKVQ